MKKILLSMAPLFAIIVAANAQNSSPYWSLAGNSNATSSSKLGTTNANSLHFYTNNVQRMIIDSTSGLIGIGITKPTEKLHINSPSGTNALRVQVNGSTKLLVHSLGGISVGSSSTPPANGLYVLGNAGIGTSTPENKLHVFKGSAGSVTAFSTAPLVVENSANCYINMLSPEASATGILFGKPSNSASGGIIYNDVSFNPNGFDFRTNGNVVHMVLNNAGNLGIGTLSPAQKLHIEGSGYFSGNLGIGTLSPGARLQIENTSNTYGITVNNTFTSTNNNTGLYARSVQGDGYGYGVQGHGGYDGGEFVGDGGSFSGAVIGVSGFALGSAGNHYGVYGSASGGTINYAGYFSGSVYTTGSYLPSARKLKTRIAPLTAALAQLLKLKPSTYQYKTAEYKDMALPEGAQIGLIAEEVKEVFPQLVKAAVHPAKYSDDRKTVLSPEVAFEAVNYQGFIPLLIGSVQEQQIQLQIDHQEIESLRTENNELKERLSIIEAMLSKDKGAVSFASAYLENPVPNPSKGSALIRYSVPDGTLSARLTLTNVKGQTLKEMSLTGRGAGQVNLNTQALPSGVYTYSLWVDGRETATKQLVIAR